MSAVYDNWEKLVRATLRREELRISAFRIPSDLSSVSASSSFNFSDLEANHGFSAAASRREDACPPGKILAWHNLRLFSFGELKLATRNFAVDTSVGYNKSWSVHKGRLLEISSSTASTNGSLIEVRKLYSHCMEGFQEWQSEIDMLGRICHPNILKLLGYSWEDKEPILVYEFMQQGSLEDHLFRRGPIIQPLAWDTRLKILIGAARGLAFLHASERRGFFNRKREREGFYQYFDPSDILLDEFYNAKISGFGITKKAKKGFPELEIEVHPRLYWTKGNVHAAPEYISEGYLWEEGDVFGFGFVLVEVLTGLRALDWTRPSGQEILVDWIKPCLAKTRTLRAILYVQLEGKYPLEAAIQVSQLALRCLEDQANHRPSMQEVVEALELIGEIS